MIKKLKRKTFDQYILEWLKTQYTNGEKLQEGLSFCVKDISNRNEEQVSTEIWKMILSNHLNYYYN